ncbi:hypothetical protein [Bacillus alkalicola]|uniref:DUF5673 domain-containing protein n=1 Tax=Evansella alkalicola TaxID=745819 RepID=A0ABS6JQW6_9BACI|nr:hypothetical protein [Bacillus alkalicola]MBU9720951.1 hypothetical protein [Bacillus alkalicola]
MIIIVGLFFIGKDYMRARNMIENAEGAMFPSNYDTEKNIMTYRGEAQAPSFRSKNWKWKHWFVVVTTLFILVIMGVVISQGPLFEWHNVVFLPVFFLLTLFNNQIPSFLVMPSGIYVDERFYRWNTLRSFETRPLKLGSNAYGLFENSSSYTEIEIKNEKEKSLFVYILNEQDVEELREILRQKGLRDDTEGLSEEKVSLDN